MATLQNPENEKETLKKAVLSLLRKYKAKNELERLEYLLNKEFEDAILEIPQLNRAEFKQ